MVKTYHDVELGCNWIAQLEELGTGKTALGTKSPLGLKFKLLQWGNCCCKYGFFKSNVAILVSFL